MEQEAEAKNSKGEEAKANSVAQNFKRSWKWKHLKFDCFHIPAHSNSQARSQKPLIGMFESVWGEARSVRGFCENNLFLSLFW